MRVCCRALWRVKCEFFACYPAVGCRKLWEKSLGGITVVLGISELGLGLKNMRDGRFSLGSSETAPCWENLAWASKVWGKSSAQTQSFSGRVLVSTSLQPTRISRC